MKSKCNLMALVGALAGLGVWPGTAADDFGLGEGVGYFRFEAGVSLPQEVSIRSVAGVDLSGVEASFDPGPRTTLALGIAYQKYFSFEIESGWLYNQGEVEDEAGRTKLDMHQVPIMANAIVRFPVHSRIYPYAGGGAGGVGTFWESRESDSDFSEDDWVFGYQAFAGVAFALKKNLDLGVFYKFLGTEDHEFGDVSAGRTHTHSFGANLVWRF